MPAGWATADMPDQRGRTVLVTGANSGNGFQVALELARGGTRVLLASRDASRGRDARNAIDLAELHAEVLVVAAQPERKPQAPRS